MSEQPSYECLPQRAHRQKRRRIKAPVNDTIDANKQKIDAVDDLGAAQQQPRATSHSAPQHPPPSLIKITEDTTKDTIPPNNTSIINASLKGNEQDDTQMEYRAAAEPGQKFEYLDHTADVQLHAWGENLQEAFENVALSMFNYMTPLKGIEPSQTYTYSAEAHDLPSLLYHWLDELLFEFSTNFSVPKTIKITKFDRKEWKIEAQAQGETFDRQRHVSGTEIKAITYSAMQINENEGDAEVFVIVDI